MTGTADTTAPPAAPLRLGPPAVAWTLAFLAWTAFVWIGRIRNALGDAALDAAGRTGPILLSVSFLALASAAAGLLVPMVRGRASDRVGRAFGTVLLVLAGWTTAVWVVRVADIALGGDHDVPFVVVHTVLGVVSVALGWAAVVSARTRMGSSVTLTGRT